MAREGVWERGASSPHILAAIRRTLILIFPSWDRKNNEDREAEQLVSGHPRLCGVSTREIQPGELTLGFRIPEFPLQCSEYPERRATPILCFDRCAMGLAVVEFGGVISNVK
jgi:hypothetical protein